MIMNQGFLFNIIREHTLWAMKIKYSEKYLNLTQIKYVGTLEY
jgi:hypothetical protein